jgi:hypothetical protein
MPRNALNVFFERVIISSLPLVAASCGGGKEPGHPAAADLAVDVAVDLGSTAATDMLAQPDLPVDVCERLHPPTGNVFPTSAVPDGGYFRTATNNQTLSVNCGTDPTCVCNVYCMPAGYTVCTSPRTLNDMGSYTVICDYPCPGAGRRPAGLEAAAPVAGCATGQYFAGMAHLEAASVHAFRVMARELAAHGAPAQLIRDARGAISDEIRHARITRRFARAHGSRVAPVKVARVQTRSLEAIALENATEGCVRETFAALVASWQARSAADPAVREAMASIAADETRHAQLAWDLDAWLARKLDRAARRRVKAARQRTAEELATEMSRPVAPELVTAVGLPDADRAGELIAAAKRGLWS